MEPELDQQIMENYNLELRFNIAEVGKQIASVAAQYEELLPIYEDMRKSEFEAQKALAELDRQSKGMITKYKRLVNDNALMQDQIKSAPTQALLMKAYSELNAAQKKELEQQQRKQVEASAADKLSKDIEDVEQELTAAESNVAMRRDKLQKVQQTAEQLMRQQADLENILDGLQLQKSSKCAQLQLLKQAQENTVSVRDTLAELAEKMSSLLLKKAGMEQLEYRDTVGPSEDFLTLKMQLLSSLRRKYQSSELRTNLLTEFLTQGFRFFQFQVLCRYNDENLRSAFVQLGPLIQRLFQCKQNNFIYGQLLSHLDGPVPVLPVRNYLKGLLTDVELYQQLTGRSAIDCVHKPINIIRELLCQKDSLELIQQCRLEIDIALVEHCLQLSNENTTELFVQNFCLAMNHITDTYCKVKHTTRQELEQLLFQFEPVLDEATEHEFSEIFNAFLAPEFDQPFKDKLKLAQDNLRQQQADEKRTQLQKANKFSEAQVDLDTYGKEKQKLAQVYNSLSLKSELLFTKNAKLTKEQARLLDIIQNKQEQAQHENENAKAQPTQEDTNFILSAVNQVYRQPDSLTKSIKRQMQSIMPTQVAGPTQQTVNIRRVQMPKPGLGVGDWLVTILEQQ